MRDKIKIIFIPTVIVMFGLIVIYVFLHWIPFVKHELFGLREVVTNIEISAKDINVVYGEKHLFTIETPEGWINDRLNAQKIGLVNFFYAKADSALQQKSYIYANGYDKGSVGETLEEFIAADLETYRKKYPNVKFEIINVGFSGGVKNGKLYSFSNLSDRYQEEVLYVETDQSIVVFSFSATTKNDYQKYQLVFDDFVKSFKYRGDNPKPFLDYFNKKK